MKDLRKIMCCLGFHVWGSLQAWGYSEEEIPSFIIRYCDHCGSSRKYRPITVYEKIDHFTRAEEEALPIEFTRDQRQNVILER